MTNQTTLTIEQAIQLASVLNQGAAAKPSIGHNGAPKKVVVCTDKRGVVFGTCENINTTEVVLKNARMCLRWSAAVGGVFGLSEKGPFDASKSGNTTVSATAPSLTLTGITAIFDLTDAAVQAWEAAPVAGR